MLRIHGVQLPAHHLALEQGRNEELREPVHTLIKTRMIHLIVVDSAFLRCVGVVRAVVLRHEVVEGRLVWVLLRSEEEEVLAEVREAGQLRRIVEGACLDGHPEACVRRLLVLDDQDLETIVQGGVLVNAVICQGLPDDR